MGRAGIRLTALALLAAPMVACIEVYRYDLVAPKIETMGASDADFGTMLCVAGKGFVRLSDKRITDTEICGAAWTEVSRDYEVQCFARESVTNVISVRPATASAFEPLQAPSCET